MDLVANTIMLHNVSDLTDVLTGMAVINSAPLYFSANSKFPTCLKIVAFSTFVSVVCRP